MDALEPLRIPLKLTPKFRAKWGKFKAFSALLFVYSDAEPGINECNSKPTQTIKYYLTHKQLVAAN